MRAQELDPRESPSVGDHPSSTRNRVTRPVMRYHGGKYLLAPWILSHFSDHHRYVEAFGGAANILLRKTPSPVEVYNDLNREVVAVFAVLRNPGLAERLAYGLRFTPYSEEEFQNSWIASDDPVEQARRIIVRAHQGFGVTGASGGKKTGWRRGIRPHGPTTSQEWGSTWEHVLVWADRMRCVFLEHKPAIDLIQAWDRADTLFYLDPPYLPETRKPGFSGYAHDMTEQEHRDLATVLRSCVGKVVLSGYASSLYDQELYPDWYRVEKRSYADTAKPRTEVLWLNPSAAAGLSHQLTIADVA